MKKVLGRILAATSLLLLTADRSVASHWGPELCEVLGWDPVDKKVFVAIHYFDESAVAPQVVYFDLAQGSKTKPVSVAWSRRRRDSSYEAMLAALRKRLVPLHRALATSIPRGRSKIVDRGFIKLEGSDHEIPTYFVQVGSSVLDSYRLNVQTYYDSSAHILAVFPIPKRQERLAIVSFIGVPYETGYEAQAPIILHSSAEPQTVERIKHP